MVTRKNTATATPQQQKTAKLNSEAIKLAMETFLTGTPEDQRWMRRAIHGMHALKKFPAAHKREMTHTNSALGVAFRELELDMYYDNTPVKSARSTR